MTGDGIYVSLVQLAAEAKISGGFNDYSAGPPIVNATNPGQTKAGEIIAEVEGKLNAKISLKYQLPITQAANIALIRGIGLAIMVERVREIITVKTGAANVEQIAAKTTADLARKDLVDLVSGMLPLPGESLVSSADGVRSYAVDHAKRPQFDRYRTQW